jgi:hypothetical protein
MVMTLMMKVIAYCAFWAGGVTASVFGLTVFVVLAILGMLALWLHSANKRRKAA